MGVHEIKKTFTAAQPGGENEGGSLRAVVIAASEIAGSNPTLAFKFQRNKMFLPRSLVKRKYCGEPPLPKVSMLDLTPPGLEFRVLCL